MDNLSVLVKEEVNEMEKTINDFFSIIPGIENAAPAPAVDAQALKEDVFIREWVSRNRPCLIKGAVKHWPAVEKWRHKDYWLSKCENFEVSVYPHQNYINQTLHNNGHERMQYHDAIERLFSNKDHVFSMPGEQITENNRFAAILNDLGTFTFMPSPDPPRWYEKRRFFTYRRAHTAWHYHGVDETLMCQVNGAKRVALFSPSIPQAKHVTHFLLKEKYLEGQALDQNLDLKPIIADVEEGDALYIPPYWHHGVVPKDGEIGFTLAFCWPSPIHILGDFSNFFVRDLYREAMWPLGIKTFLLPLLGCYAGFMHYKRKLIGAQ